MEGVLPFALVPQQWRRPGYSQPRQPSLGYVSCLSPGTWERDTARGQWRAQSRFTSSSATAQRGTSTRPVAGTITTTLGGNGD